ncbi:hypothetical protein V1514DRAFT_322783 [Lipomyces japonicus]|uniref:uncharacterized protein n=1 Tax=Lipomyces japonicus TaxID=56871 RepID=UPI0034CF3291
MTDDRELDTETKLAILSSLLDHTKSSPPAPEALLDVLVAAGGSVSTAMALLDRPVTTKFHRQRHRGVLQSSVTSFFRADLQRKRSRTAEVSLGHDNHTNDDEDWQDPESKHWKSFNSSKSSRMSLSSPAVLRNKVLHLYSPLAIQTLTACTFHPFFLPPETADSLLRSLMNDSVNWSKNKFHLFNREVMSPHTTSFYVNPEQAQNFQDTYHYNGVNLRHVRHFNQAMIQIQKIVEDVVNREVHHRGSLQYQFKGRWVADVAFCNRYDGPSEAVGYHSDQLTYIGPLPIIASISLGVSREFRLRKIKDPLQTYSLHLPHNSLLVMHPPTQEEFKHSIIPAQSVTSHPVSGQSRINITYRMYRQCYAPSQNPVCKCGIGMILRCASKKAETSRKYFWSCAGGYQREKACDMFIWADMNDNGEPTTKSTSTLH